MLLRYVYIMNAYLIAVDVDRADVGGANSSEREEAVAPPTEVHRSLV